MGHRSLLLCAVLACAAIVPASAIVRPPVDAHARAAKPAVRSLPQAPRVLVVFSFTPRTQRSSTLVRFARNRVALVQTRGRLVVRAGHRDRTVARVRRGRRVNVRITLEFDRNRLTTVAGGGRVVLRRQLVTGERLRVTRSTCCLRRLKITAWARTGRRRPVATPAQVSSPAGPASAVAGLIPLFAPTSVWNAPLPADAPLDPASGTLVKKLRDTVTANLAARTGPWIQTTDHSTPIYRVPADQPMVRVKLDAGAWATSLQSALQEVPIPPGALPAKGNDRHLTIWQPSTDRLWELFKASRQADGWHASFGGAITNVSGHPGHYTNDSWYWGATATSLPAIAGTMRIDELQAGVIPHALAMAIPYARPKVFSWPAQRTDGTSTDPNAIPEGARFRIDPALNLATLNLPPMTRMMAEAAQRYGMIVRDQTANAVGFYGEDPTPTGTNPYGGFYGGRYPIDLLRSFPWAHVQLLKMDLRSG